MRIVCHLTCIMTLSEHGRDEEREAHPKSDELDGARTETEPGDPCKDTDESHGVSIEFESSGLWEEHRAHESSLRRVETYQNHSGSEETRLN